MKKIIALFTLTLLMSATVFAGPGKKKHQRDSKDHAAEMAIPGIALEDETILIGQSPIEEEKAIALQESNNSPVAAPADIQAKPNLTARQQKRLNKAEHRLNKRIAKLKEKPNALQWNPQGTRILYIALIFAIVAVGLSIIAAILGGGTLAGIAGGLWGIAVIIAIVGLVIGLLD